MYIHFDMTFQTSFEGAQTLIHLAVSEKMENITGKYYFGCKVYHHDSPKAIVKETQLFPFQNSAYYANSLSRDRNLINKVWKVSERMVELKPYEKLK